MELNEAITGRRSVREYTDKTPDQQTVGRLLDAAVQAPSAVNQQPWTFTVVRNQGLLGQISRQAKVHMLINAPVMLAAYGAGLGTCWIGFAQGYLNTVEGKSLLGLPSSWVPVAPIILGYPNSPIPPVPRKVPEICWIGWDK